MKYIVCEHGSKHTTFRTYKMTRTVNHEIEIKFLCKKWLLKTR